MNGTIKNINIHATPLNNVHFGRVFYFPLIGKSLPDCRPRRLDGGLFFNPLFRGGKDMRQSSYEPQSKTDSAMSFRMEENRDRIVRETSKRFEEKVKQDRIRLGLEAGAK